MFIKGTMVEALKPLMLFNECVNSGAAFCCGALVQECDGVPRWTIVAVILGVKGVGMEGVVPF